MNNVRDTKSIQTAHAQIPLSQLHQSEQKNEAPERDEKGRFLPDHPPTPGAGSPKIYTEEVVNAMIPDLIDYFDVKPSREVIITQRFGNSETETPKEIANDLPTIEGWAAKQGFAPQRVSEWVKVYPAFADAVARVKAMQKDVLVKNGLKGLYDARFAIFVAINNTDMKNKSITEETGERKVVVEHKDYTNGRRVIDAETVNNPNSVSVRA